MKITIKEISACLHIIGKTSEENLSSIFILKSNVLTGDRGHLLITIKMVVPMSINVFTATDGKSKSIILKIIN